MLGRQADMHIFKERSVKIAVTLARECSCGRSCFLLSSLRKGSHPTTDIAVRTKKPLFSSLSSQ